MLCAYWTSVIVKTFLYCENCCTAGWRTPRNWFIIILNINIKTEFYEFLFEVTISILFDICKWKILTASIWTRNIDFLLSYLCFYMTSDTSFMENMSTRKCACINVIYLLLTYLTNYILTLHFFQHLFSFSFFFLLLFKKLFKIFLWFLIHFCSSFLILYSLLLLKHHYQFNTFLFLYHFLLMNIIFFFFHLLCLNQ